MVTYPSMEIIFKAIDDASVVPYRSADGLAADLERRAPGRLWALAGVVRLEDGRLVGQIVTLLPAPLKAPRTLKRRPKRPGKDPAATVIAMLGGVAVVSTELEIARGTVHSWRVKGDLPVRYHRPLLSLAAVRGVLLTPGMLIGVE